MAGIMRIVDGQGRQYEVGVTKDHALKVSVQAARAEDTTAEVLTIQKQFRGFLVDSGGSNDLNVNGSTTPVEFSQEAQEDRTIWIVGLRIVLNDVNMEINTQDFRRFGSATAVSTALTNGIELFVLQSGVQTDFFLDPMGTIGDFLNYADSYVSLPNSISAQVDFLSFDFDFDVPVVLPPGSVDRITMKVSDDLTDVDLFQVICRGYQELTE